jgi:hypothetical protein
MAKNFAVDPLFYFEKNSQIILINLEKFKKISQLFFNY